jgi:uncharacterized protein (DUF58 family)
VRFRARPRPTTAAPFPDPETLAVAERYALWLRQGAALAIEGRPTTRMASVGLDFLGYTPYAPGMDLRHLDWGLWARDRSRFVRRYADEAAGLLVVLVDASGSMGLGEPPKLSLARRLAATLAFAALCELHEVFVGVLQRGALRGTGLLQGRTAARLAFETLGAAEAEGPTDLAAGLAAVPTARGRGDAVLISDFLDPAGPLRGLEALTRLGLRVDLVQIEAAEDRAVPTEGVLLDPEGEGRRPAPQGAGVARLAAALGRLDAALVEGARQRGARLVRLPCDLALPAALERTLVALSVG